MHDQRWAKGNGCCGHAWLLALQYGHYTMVGRALINYLWIIPELALSVGVLTVLLRGLDLLRRSVHAAL